MALLSVASVELISHYQVCRRRSDPLVGVVADTVCIVVWICRRPLIVAVVAVAVEVVWVCHCRPHITSRCHCR